MSPVRLESISVAYVDLSQLKADQREDEINIPFVRKPCRFLARGLFSGRMMHPISTLADGGTGGVLSRPNRQQAVRVLSEVLSEPLKNVVRGAVEEFESEQESDDAVGETNSSQFVLLAVLGFAAAMYLANKRGRNALSVSEGSRDGEHSATESAENAESREQAAASDTTNTEPSEESESDDRDDGEGNDEES